VCEKGRERERECEIEREREGGWGERERERVREKLGISKEASNYSMWFLARILFMKTLHN
jgi:hypothetical protein